MSNDTQVVMEWMEDNFAIISDIYFPLAQHEFSLLGSYDDVFKDTIRENFKDMFFRLLCIEFTRSTGQSQEVFHCVVDDALLNNLIYQLEDLDNLDYPTE